MMLIKYFSYKLLNLYKVNNININNQVTNSIIFILISLLVFALTGIIYHIVLYIQSIGSGMGIYNGLLFDTLISTNLIPLDIHFEKLKLII